MKNQQQLAVLLLLALIGCCVFLLSTSTTMVSANTEHATVLAQVNELEESDLSNAVAETLKSSSRKQQLPRSESCVAVCKQACAENHKNLGVKKAKCLSHCPSICKGL
ncbi:hypothetical protein C9374_002338 [Naegleria lovaniensis]|uniref:Uncharacterized protein n=1 Tax=Naegleria lovaniensis TaxID=51637 RepID=A0AA88GUW8_NAELO|nr:uncharacterized protein C9374_002338 [Naegleria lovaniensis]KAG2386594.1 hypothetical protein C9374_002338 [Naegleria lovaniensis]